MDVTTCDVCGKYYPFDKWAEDDVCSSNCKEKLGGRESMKELYLWEIEYDVTGLYSPTQKVTVITEKDSYGEAERIAIKVANETWKDNDNINFAHLVNIGSSRSVYTEVRK